MCIENNGYHSVHHTIGDVLLYVFQILEILAAITSY